MTFFGISTLKGESFHFGQSGSTGGTKVSDSLKVLKLRLRRASAGDHCLNPALGVGRRLGAEGSASGGGSSEGSNPLGVVFRESSISPQRSYVGRWAAGSGYDQPSLRWGIPRHGSALLSH